jgi:hypothetical protein
MSFLPGFPGPQSHKSFLDLFYDRKELVKNLLYFASILQGLLIAMNFNSMALLNFCEK